jgi:hypothetical protein
MEPKALRGLDRITIKEYILRAPKSLYRTKERNMSPNLLTIKEILGEIQIPPDDKEHHEYLTRQRLPKSAEGYDRFSHFVSYFMEHRLGKKPSKSDSYTKLKDHLEVILLGLSRACLNGNWLLVTMDKNQYSECYFLKKYGFVYRPTEKIIRQLEADQLIEIKQGKLYSSGGTKTRVFPKKHLIEVLSSVWLQAEEPFKAPYVIIKEPDGQWSKVSAGSAQDNKDMMTINKFLKKHSWACKAPVVLNYKHSPFQSGHLITPFQNLRDRTRRIRINTLINGEPIAEVDFNANHLRLALAVLNEQYAGEQPYEDIMEAAGLDSREHAKKFITVALGAPDESKARQALGQQGFTKELTDRLVSATRDVFPALPMFEGWGLYAQNLEGHILRNVMLEGVQNDIVVLPVHDAVAVQQRHVDWAKDAMSRHWSEATGGIRTKLKVDYP